MNFKLFIILALIICGDLNAQIDSLKLRSYYGNLQSTIGLSLGDYNGNISEFNTGIVGFEITVSKEITNNIWGLNINILYNFTEEFFPIPKDYQRVSIPTTLLFGLTYGKIFGNKDVSHLYGSIGLNYGWIVYRRIDRKFSGYHGLVPQIEIGSAIKIGKSKTFENSFTSFITPKSGYSVKNCFIDIFLSWKPLLFTNKNAQGSMIIGGIRFKQHTYHFNK